MGNMCPYISPFRRGSDVMQNDVNTQHIHSRAGASHKNYTPPSLVSKPVDGLNMGDTKVPAQMLLGD